MDEASNSGEATGDHYDLIENLEGSGYADMLTGDAAHNSLTGGGGADTLIGDAGDDVLEAALARIRWSVACDGTRRATSMRKAGWWPPLPMRR